MAHHSLLGPGSLDHSREVMYLNLRTGPTRRIDPQSKQSAYAAIEFSIDTEMGEGEKA